MRKYIIIYIALCLQVAARGQTIADIDLSGLPQPTTAKALRYWIDDDIGSVQTTDILNGQHVVDVSSLLDGLHTIHYQIIDSDDKVAAPYSGIFLKMDGNLSSTTASTLRYWFDSDTNVSTCDANAGVQLLDVSMLLDGLHTLHYQVVDTEGQASYIASGIFLKMDDMAGSGNVTAEKLIYWYDDETTTTTIDMVSGVMTLDASDLLDGLHTVHYLVRCSDGSVTSAYSSIFLRMNINILSTTAQSLRYWFDNDTAVTITEIAQGIQTIDASHLLDGLHTVHYQIVDDSGAVTAPVSGIFLKMAEGIKTTTAQSLRYWFDNDTDVRTTSVAGGTQTLDVSGLLPGLHFLHYQLVDSEGQLASPMSGIFLKMFDKPYDDGQNGITKYQYWLNNNSATIRTVTLDAAANPYTLIALLPMQKEPIRSSCFHFETKGSKPMMYAKNDLHVRFTDTAGYFKDDSRQFIDYSISREVEPVDGLQGTQTFPKVAANDVRWYTMEVAPGDTAAFKLSQPATIQVFAPSGTEVFKTSESASVKWGGIHTWENGTYYLAVHDVTGSQSTMKLEYMHMDKYDVVDWDVHTVGNGGCSTITFKGNGFRDLYAVDLYNAQGDSIKSVAVAYIDDANVSVSFNFTDAPLGNYNAVFHFTTEDRIFQSILTVEEAKDIELALDVRYPSSFLRGTSTTYTISVTNKGNATAYNVPMEIYLSAGDSFANVTSVRFRDEQGKEFNNYTLDMIEKDSIDDETLAYIDEQIQKQIGPPFIAKNDSLSGEEYGFSDMLLTIPANSTSTFFIEIQSTSVVNMLVRIPSDWLTVHSPRKSGKARPKRANVFDRDWCCEKEKWEYLEEITANVVGMIPIAGCVSGLFDMYFYQTFEIACADGADINDKMNNFYMSLAQDKEKHNSFTWRGISSIIGCVSGAIGKKIAEFVKKLNSAKKARVAALAKHKDYYDSFINKQNSANYCKSEAQKAFQERRYDAYNSLMEDYDKYMNEAEELENLSNAAWDEYQSIGEQIQEFEKNVDYWTSELDKVLGAIKGGWGALSKKSQFYQAWRKAKVDCPRDPKEKDGTSTPYTPVDPNEIFGFLSEAGSKFIADSVARVNYTIEFENDTTFATAAAHTIVIKDTLDSRYFDLTKFMPTGVRIGGHETFLDEADVVTSNSKTTFVKTIDMRPEINAIAQVNGEYNQKNGIAQWTFQSLDPMTMEPTDDLMQGILPVNYNGTSGIGEVMFEVGVKSGKSDGAKINNRAGIVFDYEEAILTPTWTNIVDAVPPMSIVEGLTMVNDSTLRIFADAEDARSGVWKYVWYVQAGENAPWWKEGETESASFDYRIYEGIDYGFCVLAVDSAGNVEQKVVQRERGFKTYGEDFDEAVSLCPLLASPEEGQAYDLSGRKASLGAKGVIIRSRKKKVVF